MMGVLVLVLWVLILLLTYACATSLDCAPGCQALQELSASSPGAVTLDGGSCYSVGSAYSTPALAVSSSTAEWAPSPLLPAAPPVLDLCNQVQSIWLQPGALLACVRNCTLKLDLGTRLHAPCTISGSHLLVRGLLLRNAVLPSKQLVDGGVALPVPLAFNLSSGGNSSSGQLVLDGCTITTSCANLAQFAPWVTAGGTGSVVQVCYSLIRPVMMLQIVAWHGHHEHQYVCLRFDV